MASLGRKPAQGLKSKGAGWRKRVKGNSRSRRYSILICALNPVPGMPYEHYKYMYLQYSILQVLDCL